MDTKPTTLDIFEQQPAALRPHALPLPDGMPRTTESFEAIYGPQAVHLATLLGHLATLHGWDLMLVCGESTLMGDDRPGAHRDEWKPAYFRQRRLGEVVPGFTELGRLAAQASDQMYRRHGESIPVAAVLSLAVRHLVTDEDSSQADYTLLTAPLRRVGVTIHPDDPELPALTRTEAR